MTTQINTSNIMTVEEVTMLHQLQEKAKSLVTRNGSMPDFVTAFVTVDGELHIKGMFVSLEDAGSRISFIPGEVNPEVHKKISPMSYKLREQRSWMGPRPVLYSASRPESV